MKRTQALIVTIVLFIFLIAAPSSAQNNAFLPINTLLDQAQTALDADNLPTAQALILGANALITAEMITECSTLPAAKSLLEQATQAQTVELTRSLLIGARALIDGCSSEIQSPLPLATGSPPVTGTNGRPVITAANADQITELMRLGRGSFHDIAYSPDGQTVAVASAIGIWLYDANNLEAEPYLLNEAPGWVSSVMFSRDGSRIIAASQDSQVLIWDVSSGVQLAAFSVQDAFYNQVSYAEFSPDGASFLASGGITSRSVRVLNALDGTRLLDLSAGGASVRYNHDGTRIAVGTTKIWGGVSGVSIFDAQSGDELLVLETADDVSHVEFSPDGRLIVSAARNGDVQIWEVASGELISSLNGGRTIFNPSGTHLLVTSWRNLSLQTISGETQVFEVSTHPSGLRRVAFSPDGQHILYLTNDATLIKLDAATGQEVVAVPGNWHNGWINSLAFHPDGTRFLSTSGTAFNQAGGSIRIGNAQTAETLMTITGHESPVMTASFSPDGRYIVSGSGGSFDFDRSLRLWDAQTGVQDQILSRNAEGWISTAFSPDGAYIAAVPAGNSNTVSVWDVTTYASLLEFSNHTDRVRTAIFSPDGSQIASGSADNTVRIWDAKTGEERLILEGHSGGVNHIAFSPDGLRIATASGDSNVRIWDTQTGAQLLVFGAHTGAVQHVSFSPSGEVIASSGGFDVRVWTVENRQQLALLTGHTAVVRHVAFSPDGTLILSGSNDGTIRIWGIPTAEERTVLAQAASPTPTPRPTSTPTRLPTSAFTPTPTFGLAASDQTATAVMENVSITATAVAPQVTATETPESAAQVGSTRQTEIDLLAQIRALELSINREPNNASLYIRRGNLHSDLGNYRAAIRDYNRAISIAPSTAAFHNRGLAYAELRDYEEAIEDYNRALLLAPRDAAIYTSRGTAYSNLGQYARAIEDFDQAIELDPEAEIAFNNRGNAYRRLGNYEQALQDYDRAIEINPDYALPYVNRGVAYASVKEYELALADYGRALERDPASVVTLVNRGVTHDEMGNYEMALADYSRALELNPADAIALNNRGFTYSRLGEYGLAIADYDRALELDPNSAITYRSRGNAYLNLREYSKAIEDYTQFLAFQPDDIAVLNNRGFAYESVGDYANALKDYNAIIQLNPQNTNAYLGRAYVYARLGETEQAEANLATYVELGGVFSDFDRNFFPGRGVNLP